MLGDLSLSQAVKPDSKYNCNNESREDEEDVSIDKDIDERYLVDTNCPKKVIHKESSRGGDIYTRKEGETVLLPRGQVTFRARYQEPDESSGKSIERLSKNSNKGKGAVKH
jgi:hypothetical protein